MKVGIVGSRGLTISVEELKELLPLETTEIVSGGAKGIDSCARNYARTNGLKLTEFLPEYRLYGGKAAPLKRNDQIVTYADLVIAIYDGKSTGTAYTINECHRQGVPVTVYIRKPKK